MPKPLPHPDEIEGAKVRRPAASFNSVSTRIIVCVFAATVLSTAAVSGLCIRAIHRDLAGRIVQGFAELASDRVQAWSQRKSELSELVAAMTAAGTPWQTELARARAGVDARTALRWQAAEAPDAERALRRCPRRRRAARPAGRAGPALRSARVRPSRRGRPVGRSLHRDRGRRPRRIRGDPRPPDGLHRPRRARRPAPARSGQPARDAGAGGEPARRRARRRRPRRADAPLRIDPRSPS